MIKAALIEQIRRQIYGGQPSADADITKGLVNQYVNQGLAIAAKKNYVDNFQIEGVGFINNSFYSTFKGISITEDEQNLYKFTSPSLPLGLGSVDGISRIVFKNTNSNITYPAVLLSENQVGIQKSMRPIPNKMLCYPESKYVYIITPIIMDDYTASITMISGGSATDLNSEINVPDDYIPIVTEYCFKQLMAERMSIVDNVNDGSHAVKTV